MCNAETSNWPQHHHAKLVRIYCKPQNVLVKVCEIGRFGNHSVAYETLIDNASEFKFSCIYSLQFDTPVKKITKHKAHKKILK
jgi:hypothetical protein